MFLFVIIFSLFFVECFFMAGKDFVKMSGTLSETFYYNPLKWKVELGLNWVRTYDIKWRTWGGMLFDKLVAGTLLNNNF